jgi:hypothetical protein
MVRSFLGETETQRAREQTLELESDLSAAGFRRTSATDASMPSQVSSLPPRELRYFIEHGRFRYWFSDPDFCQCVFEGDEGAYQRFEKLRADTKMVTRDLRQGRGHQEAAEQSRLDTIYWLNPFRYIWF